jgi:L-aminopeptidase/D-esterase-like protein
MEDQMSKFTGKKKSKGAAVTTAPGQAPVDQPKTPQPVGEGRTIVAIAKELKLSPQNARRLARRHAEELGHASKGDRWMLTPDQEEAFVGLVQAERASA